MKALALFLTVALAVTLAAPKHLVFVLGDHEYSGEYTLPILAHELEKSAQVRCTILKSVPDQNGETDIPGLEALRTADLAIFYLRWRRLPQQQLSEIDRYVKSGKPVLGLRTTSHSFRYPAGDPLEGWNSWGSAAFGTPPGWGGDGHTHFGHQASTDVAIAPTAKGDPVLNGVADRFHVRSWLYRVLPKWPPSDAKVLLIGTAVDPNKPAEPNPVAWTWKNQFRGRAFYTSMGHPEDFEVESFQRLLVNAIAWCLDVKPVWKRKMEIHVPYRGMVSTSGTK